MMCSLAPWVDEMAFQRQRCWDRFRLFNSFTDRFCQGSPRLLPRLGGSLGGLTGVSMWLYFWLWFITVEGYKAKPVNGKTLKVKSGGKSATSFYESFPSGVAQDAPYSASNGWNVSQEHLLEPRLQHLYHWLVM